MVESIKVTRQCWLGIDQDFAPTLLMLARFEISWTMAAGFRREDHQMFNGQALLDLPRGTVPMMSPIYTLPYEGHPAACTIGAAYLIRTYDAENDLEDVEARFMRRPNYHDVKPDDVFKFPGPLDTSGNDIFPLAIEEPDGPWPVQRIS